MTSTESPRNKLNYAGLHKHQEEILRTLNDFYLEAQIVVSSLKRALKLKWPKDMKMKAPSTGGQTTEIRRKGEDIRQIISREIERRAYEKSIVLIVAAVEDYIVCCVRLVLTAHPERINKSLQGNDGKISIDFNELIADGMDGVIQNRISERLYSMSYTSPSKMANYLAAVLGKPVRGDAFEKYVEVKASRDLIVHARGIINDTYRNKAGKVARGELGDEIVIDKAYYKDVLRVVKQLCVSIYKIMITEFGDDGSVASAISRLNP